MAACGRTDCDTCGSFEGFVFGSEFPEGFEVFALGGKRLHAIIAVIGDVESSIQWVERYPCWVRELAFGGTGTSKFADEAADGRELLDAVIERVCDIEVPSGHCDTGRTFELASRCAFFAELRDVSAGRGGELLDPVVFGVGDPWVSGGVEGNTVGPFELPHACARRAERREISGRRRELLNPVVESINDIDRSSIAVDCDARRGVELTRSGAGDTGFTCRGANLECGFGVADAPANSLDERTCGRELLESVVGGVRRPNIAAQRYGRSIRRLELVCSSSA